MDAMNVLSYLCGPLALTSFLNTSPAPLHIYRVSAEYLVARLLRMDALDDLGS